MSYLEKLLDGVEVEWKILSDISIKISSGGTPKTGVSEYYDGDIPWLRTQEVGNGDIYSTGIKITELGLKNSSAKIIPKNCVIVAMYGATVGKVGINKIPLCTNQACANIQLNSDLINYRYVYHFLLSQYEYIKSLGAGSQTNISAHIVKKLLIPIPCPENSKKSLAIQNEIVRILDSFTALTAELTAELTARKKQFEYYRDQLLTFGDVVEWKALGDVILPVKNIRWRDTNRSYQYIDLTSVSRDCNAIAETTTINKFNAPNRAQKLILKNDVIFATTRPTQQRLCIIHEKYSKNVASTGFCILRPNVNIVLPKWLYFLISTNAFKKHIEENQSGIAYPTISDAKVKEFMIPIPSLSEQVRIVSILDKFDTLINSITEGLPKEIELRKKQYEYYRDMLLTFPKDNINI